MSTDTPDEGRPAEEKPAERRPVEEEEYDDDEYDDYDDPHYDEPHRGMLILVLGILGLALQCPMVGIVAWVLGAADIRAMDEGRMDPEGRQTTQAGKILGIAASILFAVQILLMLLYVIGIGAFFAFAK
ncbi:hypothetical protein [Fimbriiglobus ruber]|uniref:DUF4190 domain-containing protein n=1 Tax=Fimbriiglobus ruber TaxID=1908690 RepID=A0A225DSU1_9BACT|nr:hypothetical protein [Fimbriiglobus ruber]OWK44502.1 hypothetical protein FRUB_02434 [Fimbriiglobus ruber]